MKTKTIAATALIAILLSIVATAAVASSGHSLDPMNWTHGNDNQGNNNQGNQGDHGHASTACDNLTAGETLTVSNLTGHYDNASNYANAGNASGTFTFKVGTVYAEGCTVTLTGGSFKLNGTSYSVTGGTVVLNHGGRSGEGTGTTSSGTFLISVDGLHGNSTSANVGTVRLDFMTGSSQFLVSLHSMNVGSSGDMDDGGD